MPAKIEQQYSIWYTVTGNIFTNQFLSVIILSIEHSKSNHSISFDAELNALSHDIRFFY